MVKRLCRWKIYLLNIGRLLANNYLGWNATADNLENKINITGTTIPSYAGNTNRFVRINGTASDLTYYDLFGGSNAFTGNNTFSGNIAAPQLPDIQALALSASVAANALTVNALHSDELGTSSTPSATKTPKIKFRSATLTNGFKLTRSITAALSITIPSGTTLGTLAAYTLPIHVYALDNAGTIELALSLKGNIDTNVLQSTTAISGGTSPVLLYSTTERSNVAIAYLGQLIAPQTTAGTWATAHTSIVSCVQSLNKFVTLLDSTVSAVASVALTSFNANLFANIRIQGINIIPATDDTELILRVSVDNGSTYLAGTSYAMSGLIVTSAATTDVANISSAGFSAILLASVAATGGISNVTTDIGWNGEINCKNLGATTQKAFSYQYIYSPGGGVNYSVSGGGYCSTTSVVNGLQLLMATGNIASGRIIITGELT